MSNKVLLMILDGWGNGDHSKSDVIYSTNPEYINAMTAAYPHAELKTDGENVGLPEGQMGNSEVGHLNIGAGRVVYQDLVKINRACRDNSILENKVAIVRGFSARVMPMPIKKDAPFRRARQHINSLQNPRPSFTSLSFAAATTL